MNFQRGRSREEPEINLIPMIDVLLVILIFLMVTTSYAKFSELQINLPQAGGEAGVTQAQPINVGVDASEHYAINSQSMPYLGVEALAAALKSRRNQTDPTIVINAAPGAPSVRHQRDGGSATGGYGRITFTTQRQPK
jgi:biopolymer transport protein ExbD